MADTELVIKIPEETYEYWKEHKYEYVLAEAIANGTPLPKHGDLKDARDIKENHSKWLGYLDEDMITRLNIAVDKHIPTIIEKDGD